MTHEQAIKAGARIARTSPYDVHKVREWCRDNRLSKDLTAAVIKGFETEQRLTKQQGNRHGKRLAK